MKRNEQTSPPVAKIAAKVLAMSRTQLMRWASQEPGPAEIRALAASCLTQAADKSKRNKIACGLEAAIDHATGRKPGKVTRIKVTKRKRAKARRA